MQFLTKIDRALAKVEEVLLALLLVGLVVLAATQVLLRNIWSTSIDWADLTLQNATVLIGLLGAAVATSEGRHLNIDVFGRRLKGRSSFILRVVIGIFAVVICALLTRGGWETFTANYAPWKANLPAGWGVAKMLKQELAEGSFPQWLSQVLLPIGFALIGTHFVLRLFRDVGSLITGKSWEGGDEKELEGDEYLDQMLTHAEDEAKTLDDGGDGGDGADEGDEDDEDDEDDEELRRALAQTVVDDRNAALAEADDDDEPEEAVTEFEPRLRREMGRVVREKQEAEAAEGFDLAAGPVIVSKEAEEPEADEREEKVEENADGTDAADAADGEEVKR